MTAHGDEQLFAQRFADAEFRVQEIQELLNSANEYASEVTQTMKVIRGRFSELEQNFDSLVSLLLVAAPRGSRRFSDRCLPTCLHCGALTLTRYLMG